MKQSRTSRLFNAIRLRKAPKGDWEHSLPVEILEDIFERAMQEYESSPTRIAYRRLVLQPMLRCLAGVCKTWYALATPLLYQEIYISSPRALAVLARAVTKHDDLPPLVRSFQYSSMLFKSGAIEYSEADLWNLKRIYRVCTNLHAVAVERPCHGFPLTEDPLVMSTYGLDSVTIEKLTRLEVELPDGMPCDSTLLFSPNLVLPALQELILQMPLVMEDKVINFFDRRLTTTTTIESARHRMTWPKMPKLMRLTIHNWYTKHQCLSIPQDCPKLRTIELFGGDYTAESRRSWHLLTCPFPLSLESITVTARVMANGDINNLMFHQSLTELCIPMRSFIHSVPIGFPDNLQTLVIASSPERDFEEFDPALLQKVAARLGGVLELKLVGRTLPELKIVRVVCESVFMWRMGFAINFDKAISLAESAGVILTFGTTEGVKSEYWIFNEVLLTCAYS